MEGHEIKEVVGGSDLSRYRRRGVAIPVGVTDSVYLKEMGAGGDGHKVGAGRSMSGTSGFEQRIQAQTHIRITLASVLKINI